MHNGGLTDLRSPPWIEPALDGDAQAPHPGRSDKSSGSMEPKASSASSPMALRSHSRGPVACSLEVEQEEPGRRVQPVARVGTPMQGTSLPRDRQDP
jgi:hypothetical protein